MPVVTRDTVNLVLKSFSEYDLFSLDLETTSLYPFKNGAIFSAIVSTPDEDYYFNFNSRPDHLGNFAPTEAILPYAVLDAIEEALVGATIFLHNAKYDLKFLYMLNITFGRSNIYCTEALSRLVNNRLNSYSLANLGKLIGYEKDDTVEKYISKHKLYTMVDVGKKKLRKDKHYNLVPFDIISKYGMQDGRVTIELGQYCLKRLSEMSIEQVNSGLPDIMPLVTNEMQLTKVLLDMEYTGIKIDRDYCKEAYEYQKDQLIEIENKFEALTGIEFEDRNKVLVEAFIKLGQSYNYTDKGNPSFSDDNLPNNTLGNLIRDWRKAYKLGNTYYRSFLELADEDDVIHCNFRQGGTATGRMSCSEPNLQNVPKRKEDLNKYPVRRCFIPREGYFFLMVDFDQQEYRLLLDLAGEEDLIRKIKEEGLDVHSATGELCSLERHDAKQVNFAQVYGQGLGALAESLNKSLDDTRSIRNNYFRNLKKVKGMINALITTVDRRGYVVNPFGRRLYKPLEGSYKIPNHYIQGACGDIVKKAMVNLAPFLNSYKSRMLLQIHDELLFEISYDEQYIIEEIVDIMQKAYNYNTLPLTAGCDFSKTDWHRKEAYETKKVLR